MCTKGSQVTDCKTKQLSLKDWHFEHMQKTILKYVSCILDYATPYQKKMHNKYSGNLTYVRRTINVDIKQGVTRDKVITFLKR